jgi:large-conductance mechanosensitive channel
MLRGFTKFMMRRNMMVMAVGIIIGATFGKIVASCSPI